MTAPTARRTETVIGLDFGTTTAKALIRRLASGPGRFADANEHEAVVVEQPTPWTVRASGTELDAGSALDTAVLLLGDAVRAAEAAWGAIAVSAVSVTGLAESGILLDPDGRAVVPAVAWFDPRGHDELGLLAAHCPSLAAAFPGATGLPWTAQAALAKLLWLRERRPIEDGSCWLSLPEWIVHGLGGARTREPSLASRTGLIRQVTGAPWDALLDAAALPADLLPDAAAAGTPVGTLAHPGVPAAAAGALLSVAGHDHPVAALAVGAVGAGELFNSSGTADVLARAVPAPLTDEQRAAVVAARWSAGAHVVPGTGLLLAGGSGGLLLRRVLGALGAQQPADRERLDAAGLEVSELPPGVLVSGDGRERDDVEIRIKDDATPAAIWAAATAYTADLSRRMLADIEPIVGPHRRGVAAGGWTRLAGVRAAKTAALGPLTFVDVPQPGATGAAMVAEASLTGAPLTDASLTLTDTPPNRGLLCTHPTR